MSAPDRDPLAGPRKAALAVVIAAGKVLFLAAFLPALDACDRTWVPARGFVSGDDAFMLPPHIIGLVAALAGVLFWRRWSARMRALEIGLTALAALVTLALGAFFFFSIEGVGGPALGALCLALLLSLFARAQMSRWRAARALVVLGLDCAIWYFFWLIAFSLGDGEDAVRVGTYVACGASVLLFAAARRLEGTVRRWRPRDPGAA
ncbi:MAG TPA: hypothetical protein VFU21_02670 [Kofleriaceae bacterium]|nr:hypothetical protein [Kofleriaceae bacterium]